MAGFLREAASAFATGVREELHRQVLAERQRAMCLAESSPSNRLVLAAGVGNVEVVRELLANGVAADSPADGRGKVGAGQTALMAACLQPYTDVLKLLLQRGADPNQFEYGVRFMRAGRRSASDLFCTDLLSHTASPNVHARRRRRMFSVTERRREHRVKGPREGPRESDRTK